MKRKNVLLLIALGLVLLGTALFSSCADEKTIDGKVYKPYGFANKDARQCDSIVYEISPGSVICGILFVETIVVPVYVFGWDLYEPVGKK